MLKDSRLLFSIVIPTYNRSSLIIDTLKSVLNQTYTNFEVIVVDDGGNDDTAEVVESFDDARIIYVKKKNEERAAARNFGIRLSKGSYVTFLDSDDLFNPNHLEVAFNFLLKENHPDVFHIGYDVIFPNGRILYPWKPLPDPANEKLLEGNFLSCLGVFVKREILIENPFNEYRPISGSGEDYELWLRLAARFPIRTCPESTARLVNHETRGVLLSNVSSLLRHSDLLRNSWLKDEMVMRKYGSKMKKLTAYLDLYVALHLAMSKERRLACQTLVKSLANHPRIVLNYRFLVVLKKIILN